MITHCAVYVCVTLAVSVDPTAGTSGMRTGRGSRVQVSQTRWVAAASELSITWQTISSQHRTTAAVFNVHSV